MHVGFTPESAILIPLGQVSVTCLSAACLASRATSLDGLGAQEGRCRLPPSFPSVPVVGTAGTTGAARLPSVAGAEADYGVRTDLSEGV